MENNIEISIVILSKNAAENIHETLSMLFKQSLAEKIEVIVIDSGSQDDTVDIIKSFSKVRLIQNPPENFHHGKTRNMGGKLAQGKYIVFLNGDAVPKNKKWLEKLVSNFQTDDNVVATYSRHLPKEDCNLYMRIVLLTEFGPVKEIINIQHLIEEDKRIHFNRFIRFSTVSCAVRKDAWVEMPFNESISIGEDQDWSKRMLELGRSIVYEPSSVIIHSHNYSFNELYNRNKEGSKAFNKIFNHKKSMIFCIWRLLLFPFHSLKESLVILNYAAKKKYGWFLVVKEIVIALNLRFAALLGLIIGNK